MAKRCLICNNDKELTKHHVFPRDYNVLALENPQITLCRECHDRVHKKFTIKKGKIVIGDFIEIIVNMKTERWKKNQNNAKQ